MRTHVLESHAFPSPFPFPLENEIAGKNASGIPTPSSKSNYPRTWTAANRSNAAEQFTGGPRDSGLRLRFLHLLLGLVTELTNRRGRETLQGDERSRRYVFRGEKWKLSITK